MNRTIPENVKRTLREEVGFGCPVPDCGLPYLEWHHFDPPWHIQNHHNAQGMIALCREHHIQADNGAFTKEQLHAFKSTGRKKSKQIRGKFNWMRNRILAVVGGNFYYETLVIFKFKGQPIIWFERDQDNYLLLNLNMLTTSKQPRAFIKNNEWFNVSGEEDIECPPSAKKIKIKYLNGDMITVEFFELTNSSEVNKKYPDANIKSWKIDFPITAVEVTNVVANSGLEFNAKETKFGMGNVVKNCFISGCGTGLEIA